MKQPDFKRKAIGLLLAPFALAALPASAAPLSVNVFDMDSSLYAGTDVDGTIYYFHIPSSTECNLVGIDSQQSALTIPETVTRVVDDNPEAMVTEDVDVTGLHLNDAFSWSISPLGWCEYLTDLTLTDKITDVDYHATTYHGYDVKLHFTSDTAPVNINVEGEDMGYMGYQGMRRVPIYVPETAVDAYKDAFMSAPCLVVAEGGDPMAAFEQLLVESKAIRLEDNDGTSGINILTWIGSDEAGNKYGFEEYNGMITLRGIITKEASITIPESVTLVYPEYYIFNERPVQRFCLDYYDEGNTGFPGCDNLTDIYVPACITETEWNSGTNPGRFTFHFTSETAPTWAAMRAYDVEYGIVPRFAMVVPEAALEAYKEVFPEDRCYVVAEGTDPREKFAEELASIEALRISPDSDCVPHASWSGKDEKGTVYAFESPYRFRGAITTEKSITIPEQVCVTDPAWYAYSLSTIDSFIVDNYNDDDTGFPGCSALDVYVPASVTYCEFHGDNFAGRFNFHYAVEQVPEFWFYDSSVDNVNLYVPEELFETYTEALGSRDYVLFSETPATPVNVNVATPGTLADQVSSLVDNLNQVRWLVVTGTPDDIDLRMIRRLPRLEKLDLSATTGLTSVGGCNGLKYLREVILPEGITSLDNNAFLDCRRLETVVLPETLTEIGRYAFANTGIHQMNLENVVELKDFAFYQSRISDVDLKSAEVIGTDVFLYTPLNSVKLGENIREIGNSAFRSAQLKGVIEIPAKVTSLNHEIFAYNEEITKFIIHKDVTSIDYYAFEGTRPEVVECNILFPIDQNGFRDAHLDNCTLYVPALTRNEYLLHDNWVNFTVIEPLEGDVTALDIDREYTLKSDKGVADKADLNMVVANQENYWYWKYGHLTVDRTAALNLGNYRQGAYYDGSYWDPSYGYRYGAYYNGSTIIPESTVTADNVEVNLALYKDRWYFLSFPFDVNVKDIVVDEDALWVVRKYSGEARANLDENTWQNMTDETVLKAGEGYIFNCASENNERVNFKFTPATNGNALFAKDVVAKELTEYVSEFAHNASWNLVGNTFPAYLNLKGIEFDAPITVWQDNNYYAYSPVDDDYVLEPFQAFFVQHQSVEGGNAVKLNPAARAHTRDAAAALDLSEASAVARAPRATAPRSLFNIYVKGENGMDRTRIVVNEKASAAYEANRDASKFMSTMEAVPQIYVNNSGVRMAINEAPLGNGQFTLGTRFGQSGSYTVSLDTRNASGYSVLLTDNLTGITTDLTASSYTFNADAATDDNRFTITIGLLSGVENAAVEGLNVSVDGNVLNVVAEEAVEIMVVAADGKVIASEKSADFNITLSDGIYVVKAGNVTTKVVAGK